MKMKLREVNKHLNALAGLGEKIFPARLGYAISCNIEKLQRESERIEKEREKLCEQYAEKDGDGNCVMVDSIIDNKKVKEYKMADGNRELFRKEYDDLLDTEVEVEIRTVKQEDIEQCGTQERYSIPSVAEIVGMGFMVEG